MSGIFDSGIFDSGIFDESGGATTQTGSWTADAVLRVGRTGSFTADAVIPGGVVTIESSFTANAVLRVGQSGSLTADVVLRLAATGSVTAKSVLRKSTLSSISANAILFKTRTWVRPLNAILRKGRSGSIFVAKAFIRTAGTFGGAFDCDAMIAIEALNDTFSRVEAEGLGGIWQPAPPPNFMDPISNTTVDGSVVTQAASTDTDYIGYPMVREGLVQWDFKLPNSEGWFWSALDGFVGPQPYEVEVWDNGDGTLGADVWPHGTGTPITVPFTVDVWYTIKAYVSDGFRYIKVWERGTAEPDWQGTYTPPVWTNQWTSYFYLEGESTQPVQYDNVFIRSFADWRTERYFTANAVLKRSRAGTLTADAVIGSRGFTADAALKRGLTQSFTANARLRVIQTGSFTAEAGITGFLTNAVILRNSGTKTFVADAYFLAHSFIARAVIAPIAPGAPGGPPAGTILPLSIKVSGIDITADVMITGATFTQAVNARPGQFAFEVKDDEHIYQFVSGGRVTCDIDGRRLFDGYVNRATLRYAFPVDMVVDPDTTPRIWKLEGPDLNILFQKRLVFDQVNPRAELMTYAAGASDRTIILDAIRDNIDLDGDEITTDGVMAVGSPNPDAPGYIIEVGATWAAFMAAVAQLPGAVWGLTQDRDLFYEDDDTENAPFQLSDTPNGTTTIGYANFNWTDDGTKLVNDAQVWGAGTGSTTGKPTYSEVTDATSIADHGRWQLPGQWRGDMFTQGAIDDAANSIVYGSAQNLHGGKDPYILVNCRIKQHGLRAGQKIRIINNVYGLDVVLPIRRITVTFVNAQDVLYDLELTREIDQPWFFAEYAGYPWDFKYGGGKRTKLCPPGKIRVNGRCVPITWKPPPPGGCDCGITDTFTRTVANFQGGYYDQPNGWATSEQGTQWTGSCIATFVDGTSGVLGIYAAYPGYGSAGNPPSWALPTWAASNVWGQQSYLNWGFDPPGAMDVLIEMQLSRALAADDQGPYPGNPDFWGDYFSIFFGDNSATGKFVIEWTGNVGVQIFLWSDDGESGWYAIPVDMTQPFKVHVTCGGAGQPIEMRMWASSGIEPASPLISLTGVTFSNHGLTFELKTENEDLQSPLELHVLSLDIAGVNLCSSVQFDDFNRTVASGWGTATPGGQVWGPLGGYQSGTTVSVNGSAARLSRTSGQTSQGMFTPSYPPVGTDGFSMRVRFRCGPIYTGNSNLGWAFQLSDELGGQFFYVVVSNGTVFGPNHNGRITAGGTSSYTKFDWVAGTWYTATYEETAIQRRAKVWADGEAEPSWQSVVDTTDWYVETPYQRGGYFVLTDTGPAMASEYFEIDYIEFDYAGKPCYLDCGPTDTFTRDVDPGWGTSDAGLVWSEGVGSSGTFLTYDDGSQGFIGEMWVNSAGASMSQEFATLLPTPFLAEVMFLATKDGSDLIALGGLAENNIVAGSLNVNKDTITAASASVALIFRRGSGIGNGSDPVTQLQFYRNPSSAFDYVTSPISVVKNVWYHLKFTFDASVVLKAKIWAHGHVEPVSWVTSAISAPSTAIYERFSLAAKSQLSTNAQMFVDYDNLNITGICGPTPVATGAGVAQAPKAGAYGCETATRISSTSYEVSLMYIGGTASVYLNGRIMRLTYDYTEDHLSRLINFVLPVGSGDVVYVCYQAIGVADWRPGDV